MQKKKKCAESKKFLESKNLIGRKDGITLIALVVTIIILLILAGVALTAMINGGIFDKAKEATTKTQIGKEKEQIATSYAKYKMESAQGKGTTLTVEGASVTGNDTDGWTITFEDTGNTYKIHPDGKVEETGKVEKEPPLEPTDIYVTLYADGTLGFSNNEEKIAGKEESRSYGNIKGQSFEGNNPWYENKESITTIEFQTEIVPTETAYWFYNCKNLTEINNISNLNTSSVNNMDCMFDGCSALTELNLKSFNTSKVTNMRFMFLYCSSLTELDLSSLDTSSVTNMYGMFELCTNMERIDVSNFDTGNVTDMSYMFYGCDNLTQLDVKDWKTDNTTNMRFMFSDCRNLVNLDLTGFNTSNVTDMSGMFNNCVSLTQLDFKNFNTSKVTNMERMFSGCSGLTELNLKNFDTSSVTDMSQMFFGIKLTQLDLSNFNTSNVENMENMFWACSSLAHLDLSNFDTGKVTSMKWMFLSCSSLKELDLSSFDTSNVTDMTQMFNNCTNLKVVYGRKDRWITTNVNDNSGMWGNCGTNHITYKTYLEGDKVVGYEITKGYGWRASGSTRIREGNNKRASCVHFIQLDPEKQYKIEMKNSNYDFGYVKVDIDLKTLFDSGWQSPDEAPIITDTEYMLVNFGSHPSRETQITDEMLAEIEEAFSITVVE